MPKSQGSRTQQTLRGREFCEFHEILPDRVANFELRSPNNLKAVSSPRPVGSCPGKMYCMFPLNEALRGVGASTSGTSDAGSCAAIVHSSLSHACYVSAEREGTLAVGHSSSEHPISPHLSGPARCADRLARTFSTAAPTLRDDETYLTV